MVGLIPLYAVDCITPEDLENFKEFATSFKWFSENRNDLCSHCVTPIEENGQTKYLLTLMEMPKIEKILKRVWDPSEFRSDFGLRSLSKYHEKNPYELLGKSIKYEPAEAESVLMGGNSNWRGPIWFPTSFLFIEALKNLDHHTNGKMKIEGKNPLEMAKFFADGMIKLFKKGKDNRRPIYADSKIEQEDPHFQDLILFYEHFHGDNGRGLGASHQTGWSGLVANLIDEWL
jgi:hypothetical protein